MQPAPGPCRIAVIGAGAVGQFYGAQLILAGHQVSFLARRDARRLRERGLDLTQAATPQVASTAIHPRLQVPPDRFRTCTRSSELRAEGDPDWLLVAAKLVEPEQIAALILPALGPRTRVAVLANGLGAEETLEPVCGADRLFGVLCFVCINRHEDGRIEHLAHGQVEVGHHRDREEERHLLGALLTGVGIRVQERSCLLEARWRKLGWNVPYNGLCTLHDCATDAVLSEPVLRRRSRMLMAEVIAIANADLAARGRAPRIEAAWADEMEGRTACMRAYCPSTLLDRRAGRILELDLIFREPLRRGLALGVPCPELSGLVDGLERLPGAGSGRRFSG